MTFLFNYGNEYRTINLHRSAISAFHEYIDGLPSLKIYAFPSDTVLCVVAALDYSIERSSIWREKNQTSQLLVSFIKPHNAVAKSTVAGWAKQVVIMCGINTDFLKPHSTRSASSLHARLSGLSLSDILEWEFWSNKTAWEKFYDKPILNFEEKFQKAVVN